MPGYHANCHQPGSTRSTLKRRIVDESLRTVVEFQTRSMEEGRDSPQPILIQQLLERGSERRDGQERLGEVIEWKATMRLKPAFPGGGFEKSILLFSITLVFDWSIAASAAFYVMHKRSSQLWERE